MIVISHFNSFLETYIFSWLKWLLKKLFKIVSYTFFFFWKVTDRLLLKYNTNYNELIVNIRLCVKRIIILRINLFPYWFLHFIVTVIIGEGGVEMRKGTAEALDLHCATENKRETCPCHFRGLMVKLVV